MDLIYTDKNRVDLGIISEYLLDLAFGKDENDFEIQLNLNDACLSQDFYIYIEDTPYGGIVDNINPNTSNETVNYSGRTWHGLLDSKIVVPDKGEDYLIVDGDANIIIQQLLTRCGLNSLFTANTESSNIIIHNFKFPRYIGLYQGLRRMLFTYGAKLDIIYSDRCVKLSAIPYVNYMKDEEWDTSTMAIELNRHFNPVNHLYCLGADNLKNRKVIQLFTDETGVIQPYSTTDNPLKDSDYILDSRNQVLTGILDNAAVFDYNNAQLTENYEIINSIPDNWNETYVDYYEFNIATNTYDKIEREYQDAYVLLQSAPADWAYAYTNYYYKEYDTYKNIDDSFVTTETTYPLLSTQPPDWNTNYKNYYYYWTDGVTEEYKNVESIKYPVYEQQTKKPTDWSANKGNYYIEVEHWDYTYIFKKKRDGIWDRWEVTYHDLKVEEFTKKDYICKFKKKELVSKKKVKISDFVADKSNKAKMSDFNSWKNSKYKPFYTKIDKEKAPIFDATIHRVKSVSYSSPTFQSNMFYEKTTQEIIPMFWVGGYFNKVYDNYADLVSNGIAKLQDYWNLDNINISLDTDEYVYDIDDIVGATEHITNITVTSNISKKIVTINNGDISIQYELGNEDTTDIN